MKKLFLSITLFSSAFVFSQESAKNEVWFVKGFQVGLGVSNLLPNKSMMGEAHRTAVPVIYARLGVFHINQFTVGLHGNMGGMEVDNSQYYGDFDKTSFYTIGPYVSYFQPISESSLLEPYISYDYTDFRAKYQSKKLKYDSNGLGLGLDYEYKISNGSYFMFGLKYSITKLKTETNRNWEDYLNKYNFVSAKIGFTFAKNRL